jgi:hypothetical protein
MDTTEPEPDDRITMVTAVREGYTLQTTAVDVPNVTVRAVERPVSSWPIGFWAVPTSTRTSPQSLLVLSSSGILPERLVVPSFPQIWTTSVYACRYIC